MRLIGIDELCRVGCKTEALAAIQMRSDPSVLILLVEHVERLLLHGLNAVRLAGRLLAWLQAH